MFERFTADARQVVVGAQPEARALHHDWIGTEHLLLAALRSGEITAAHIVLGVLRAGGLAARVVAAEGVQPDDVRRAVLERLGRAA